MRGQPPQDKKPGKKGHDGLADAFSLGLTQNNSPRFGSTWWERARPVSTRGRDSRRPAFCTLAFHGQHSDLSPLTQAGRSTGASTLPSFQSSNKRRNPILGAVSGFGHVLIPTVINDMATDMSGRLTKFSDGLKLRGKVHLLDDRIRIPQQQKYLSR